MKRIKLNVPDKSGGEAWGWGEEAYVDAEHVVAIEPRVHRYHSFRPEQVYTAVHLSTGAVIEVMQLAGGVAKMVKEATE